MCDPVTATALALSAGGSYLQQREADKNAKRVQDAKNNAFEAEQIRQRAFQDEVGAAFGENVNKQGRENFDEQKQVEEDRFKQAFAERRVQPDYNTGLRTNAPKNVVLARQAESDKASAETDRDVGNLAGLQGYGNALFNQGLDQSQFARLFGNVQDKAYGQTRLLPLRMQSAANNARKSPSLFPTLLKTGGQALSFASAGGSLDGGNGFVVPFTGSSGSVSASGIPIPGKKPVFLQGGPFGTLGGV